MTDAEKEKQAILEQARKNAKEIVREAERKAKEARDAAKLLNKQTKAQKKANRKANKEAKKNQPVKQKVISHKKGVALKGVSNVASVVSKAAIAAFIVAAFIETFGGDLKPQYGLIRMTEDAFSQLWITINDLFHGAGLFAANVSKAFKGPLPESMTSLCVAGVITMVRTVSWLKVKKANLIANTAPKDKRYTKEQIAKMEQDAIEKHLTQSAQAVAPQEQPVVQEPVAPAAPVVEEVNQPQQSANEAPVAQEQVLELIKKAREEGYKKGYLEGAENEKDKAFRAGFIQGQTIGANEQLQAYQAYIMNVIDNPNMPFEILMPNGAMQKLVVLSSERYQELNAAKEPGHSL